MNPLVSIIVLSWNARGMLRQCLTALLANLPPFPVEILVVDNGSTDGTQEMVTREFAHQTAVRILSQRTNLGYAAGNNAALRVAQGSYVLFLNDDIILSTDALQAMVAFLQSHPDYGGATVRLENPDGTLQYYMHRRFPRAWILPLALLHKRFPRFRPQSVSAYCYLDENFKNDMDIQQAAGACLMLSRTALVRIGGFFDAAHFPLYYNDVDLCRRLWDAQLPVRCLATAVTHFKGRSVQRVIRWQNIAHYMFASLWYFKKQHMLIDFWLLRCWYAMLLLIFLPFTLRKKMIEQRMLWRAVLFLKTPPLPSL